MQKSLIFLLLIIKSLASFSQPENTIPKVYNTFNINDIIDIKKCKKWQIDFSRLKSTVLYKKYYISMGIHGGMVAIDTNLNSIDKRFTNLLNTDLFNNLTVRKDTLFAKKKDEIYFFNTKDEKWKKYKINEPILLFDILYEDDNFIFFPIDGGERGSVLIIFDKKINKLRILSTNSHCKQIFFNNGNYYIICSTKSLAGTSEYCQLNNIDSIKVVKYNKKLFKTIKNNIINNYPEYINHLKTDNILKNILIPEIDINFNNALTIKNKVYHFTDYDGFKSFKFKLYEKTYLTTIVNNKLIRTDSIRKFEVIRTKKYNNKYIIEANEKYYYILKNDTLFEIFFKWDHKFRKQIKFD